MEAPVGTGARAEEIWEAVSHPPPAQARRLLREGLLPRRTTRGTENSRRTPRWIRWRSTIRQPLRGITTDPPGFSATIIDGARSRIEPLSRVPSTRGGG